MKNRDVKEQGTSERSVKKESDNWTKTDEVLNHLALVGLRDGVPSRIQQTVRQKILSSRKALLYHAEPEDIAQPLLDLAEIINDFGLETGGIMNQKLDNIRASFVEATKENNQLRTKNISKSSRDRDINGLEMKMLLNQSKNVLDLLSDLNELKMTLRSSVEYIFKIFGFTREMPTPAGSGVDDNIRKLSVKLNCKKIGGILDHVMRVCQRANIPADLKQVMLAKVAASRKYLRARSGTLEICGPLYELVDILNGRGFESSELIRKQLKDFPESAIKKDGETLSEITSREMNGIEMRKTLDRAKTHLNYLSTLNELKMIIKNSADLIKKSGTHTGERLKSIKQEESSDLNKLTRDIDASTLSGNLNMAVKTIGKRVKTEGTPR